MLRFGRNPYVYVSGAFGAIWVLVAWTSPDNSYYLFPPLVAASVPVSYRLIAGRPLPRGFAAGAGVAGLFNVFLLGGMLAIAGKLNGPSILPGSNPFIDGVVLSVAGASVGVIFATTRLGNGGAGGR